MCTDSMLTSLCGVKAADWSPELQQVTKPVMSSEACRVVASFSTFVSTLETKLEKEATILLYSRINVVIALKSPGLDFNFALCSYCKNLQKDRMCALIRIGIYVCGTVASGLHGKL